MCQRWHASILCTVSTSTLVTQRTSLQFLIFYRRRHQRDAFITQDITHLDSILHFGRARGDLSPYKAGGLILCKSRVSCKTCHSFPALNDCTSVLQCSLSTKKNTEHVNIPSRIIWQDWTLKNVKKIIEPFGSKWVTLVLPFRGDKKERLLLSQWSKMEEKPGSNKMYGKFSMDHCRHCSHLSRKGRTGRKGR